MYTVNNIVNVTVNLKDNDQLSNGEYHFWYDGPRYTAEH